MQEPNVPQLQLWRDLRAFAEEYPLLTDLILIALIVIAAFIMVRLINRGLRKAYWNRRGGVSPEHTAELRRSKRQQTILTLMEGVVRYSVFGAAALLSVSLLFQGAVGAVFGASLLVVIVGFGLQRLLIDVISGSLLLFEDQFSVGDFIEVHFGGGIAGIVEEVSLRYTTLRTLSGDRIVVLNGNIGAFTKLSSGYRDFYVEFLVRDIRKARPAVNRVVERNVDSPHARYLLGPHLSAVEAMGTGDITRIELRAVVPPSLEWLAESSLPEQLKEELGDLLVGNVEVFNISEPAFSAYRSSVLVRE